MGFNSGFKGLILSHFSGEIQLLIGMEAISWKYKHGKITAR